jgi:hypothetical protein
MITSFDLAYPGKMDHATVVSIRVGSLPSTKVEEEEPVPTQESSPNGSSVAPSTEQNTEEEVKSEQSAQL